MPVLFVRHAVAVARKDWRGPDHLRPLDERGTAQAEALVAQLAPYRAARLLSSPTRRCVDTLAPLARALGLEVEEAEALGEGQSDEALTLVRKLAPETVALCSHGDVIPGVLEALAAAGVDLGDRLRCKKGSTWVLEAEGDRLVCGTYLPPPA